MPSKSNPSQTPRRAVTGAQEPAPAETSSAQQPPAAPPSDSAIPTPAPSDPQSSRRGDSLCPSVPSSLGTESSSDSAFHLPPSTFPTEPPPRRGEESVLTEEMTVLGNSPILLRTLPITQYRVLIELWAGRSIRHAAEICDIHRVTVHRWMREDARFIAALNQAQESNLQEVTARMSGLAAKSMDKLSNAVDHGDVNAAKFVINHVTKTRPGPHSPRVIAKRIRRRHQRIEEYLNSPDDQGQPSAQTPKITSTINEPPVPAALPPMTDDKALEEKGEAALLAPEAPESGTA